jgi:hypothetical protein
VIDIIDALVLTTGAQPGTALPKVQPLHSFNHGTEGYALDWSPVVMGR